MKGKVGGQWNEIFMDIYRSILHGFLPFFALTVKTDEVRRGREDVDPHGRFRGKWVKELCKHLFKT